MAHSWAAQPVLKGELMRLEPLLESHAEALARVGLYGDLWRLQPRQLSTGSDMHDYVASALAGQREGRCVPFVIVDVATSAVIGSTRLMDLAINHRRLEIGASWLAPSHQGTGANIEAKLLLLAHAFEALNVQKVVLKTEAANVQSRRAIEALGAMAEGTFRRHFLAEGGRPRDMVFYAIFVEDWPRIAIHNRRRLARKLGFEGELPSASVEMEVQ